MVSDNGWVTLPLIWKFNFVWMAAFQSVGEAKFTAIYLRYVIVLNIHYGMTSLLRDCCTLTSTANFCSTLFHARYSVDIYKCTNASELISLSRSLCRWQKLWTTPVHIHIAIATEVIQLPHCWQQACFTIEVWLVILTNESVLASNKTCCILVFCCGEGIALAHSFEFSRSTNLESKLIEFFVFVNF